MIDLVAVRKRWFKIKEYDPHTTKKTTQKNTKRNKAASVASDASKAKKTRASPSNDGNTDDESDDGIEMSQPLAKKAKLENDDDTAEDISAYIYVSITYTNFLSTVARAVRCAPTSLIPAQMQWKFDRPGNAQYKPIMDQNGYRVMISTVVGRHKDFVISISMPPPTPSVQDVVCFNMSSYAFSMIDYNSPGSLTRITKNPLNTTTRLKT